MFPDSAFLSYNDGLIELDDLCGNMAINRKKDTGCAYPRQGFLAPTGCVRETDVWYMMIPVCAGVGHAVDPFHEAFETDNVITVGETDCNTSFCGIQWIFTDHAHPSYVGVIGEQYGGSKSHRRREQELSGCHRDVTRNDIKRRVFDKGCGREEIVRLPAIAGQRDKGGMCFEVKFDVIATQETLVILSTLCAREAKAKS